MATPFATHRIDVRTLAPAQRHATILGTLSGLGDDEQLELVVDHEPRPLFTQLETQLPGRFSWQWLDRGPVLWRVLIGRKAQPHGHACCGGGCGG